VIVDLILETRITGCISARLTLQHDETTVRHNQASPNQQFSHAAERALSGTRQLLGRSAGLCKRAIGRHKSREHGRDQFARVSNRPSGFSSKGIGVSEQVTVHGRRKFYR